MKSILLYFTKLMLLMSLVLETSSCTNLKSTQIQDKELKQFYEGKKGIVILQNSLEHKDSKEEYIIKTIWEDEQNGKVFIADPQNLKADLALVLSIFLPPGIYNTPTIISFIEPGDYKLTNISLDYMYYPVSHDILGFSIKGGEIVYLGKIKATHNVKHKKVVRNIIRIHDDYEVASRCFQNHYPQITQAPIKRLMQFNNYYKKLQYFSAEYNILVNT